MIILKNEKGITYNLYTKSKHIVGRHGDLELEGDKSVSRQHACITVTIVKKRPTIVLEDLGSKYGTFVNAGITTSKEIAKNARLMLNVGDKIRFGQQWNTWRIEEVQFIVCTSAMNTVERNEMKSLITPFHGILVTEWTDNCHYLTMNQIIITVKVVCALGAVKPIVKMDYWRKLSVVLSSSVETSLPDCDKFIPPLAEQMLIGQNVSFVMDNNRRTMFRGIKFAVFNPRMLANTAPMVKSAGGEIVNGNEMEITENKLLNEKIIIMEDGPGDGGDASSKFSTALKYLKKNKLRAIPEPEIGLSIIYVSLEKYCNPAYDAHKILEERDSQPVIMDEDDKETQENEDVNDTVIFESQIASSLELQGNISTTDSVDDSRMIVNESIFSQATQADEEEPIDPGTNIAKRKVDCSQDGPSIKNPKLDYSSRTSSFSGSCSSSALSGKKTNDTFELPERRSTRNASGGTLFSFFKKSNASGDPPKPVAEKRKLEDSFSESSRPKRQNSKKTNLFDLPDRKKRSMLPEDPIVKTESQPKFDSQPKLKDKENLEDSVGECHSTVIPKNISLSQFVGGSQYDTSKYEIKKEPLEKIEDLENIMNKIVIHTVPLVKEDTVVDIVVRNSSAINFKTFRKNNVLRDKSAPVISSESLVLYESRCDTSSWTDRMDGVEDEHGFSFGDYNDLTQS